LRPVGIGPRHPWPINVVNTVAAGYESGSTPVKDLRKHAFSLSLSLYLSLYYYIISEIKGVRIRA